MSMEQKNCWEGFHLYEIEVDRKLTRIGYAHNACAYSRIFAELRFDMVKAVYTLRDSDQNGFYYKVLTPIYTSGTDVITTKELDCRKVTEWAESCTDDFDKGITAECLQCRTETNCIKNNKHFCSLQCMWHFEKRYKKLCQQMNVDIERAMKFYKYYSDADFAHGAVAVVKKFKSD